jgi:hypothetical protein
MYTAVQDFGNAFDFASKYVSYISAQDIKDIEE